MSKRMRKIAAIPGGASGNTVTSGLMALGLLLSDAIDSKIWIRDRRSHRALSAKPLDMSFMRLVDDSVAG